MFDVRISSLFILHFLAIYVRSYILTTPTNWMKNEKNRICVFRTEDDEFQNTELGSKMTYDYPYTCEKYSAVDDIDSYDEFRNPFRMFNFQNTYWDKRSQICTNNFFNGALDTYVTINQEWNIICIIQAAKRVYRPSQTVHIRIITIRGPKLLPSNITLSKIWVTDTNYNWTKNVIAEWVNIQSEGGLIHLEFPLDSDVKLGIHVIHAKLPNGKTYKEKYKVESSQVKKLPFFEVEIKGPQYIIASDEITNFTICAMYKSGEPVEGYANVHITEQFSGFSITYGKKKEELSGCKVFSYSNEEIPKYKPQWIGVHVKVNNSENEVTSYSLVKLVYNDIFFEDKTTEKFLKPELPFTAKIKTYHIDGTTANNEEMEVCAASICKTVTTSNNGILKFTVPPHHEGPFKITALNNPHTLLNVTRDLMKISSVSINPGKYRSNSNSSLAIVLEDRNVVCNSPSETVDITFPVNFATQEQNTTVTVQVLVENEIILTKVFNQTFKEGSLIEFDDSQLLWPIEDPISRNVVRGHFNVSLHIPKTHHIINKVIVWFTRNDGEVVADYISLTIRRCEFNEVVLKWTYNESDPSEPINIALKTQPQSKCSLGIVDKNGGISSLNWESLKEVTEPWKKNRGTFYVREVKVDFSRYCRDNIKENPYHDLLNTTDHPDFQTSNCHDGNRRFKREVRPPWTDIFLIDSDAYVIFELAGLTVSTNKAIKAKECLNGVGILNYWAELRKFYEIPPQPRYPVGTKTKTTKSTNEKTALWRLMDIPEDGTIDQKFLPHDVNVSEWIGNAVCVHATKGLGASNIVSIKPMEL